MHVLCVIKLLVISGFCAHLNVYIMFSCHVMIYIINHSPHARYEKIFWHINVLGQPYTSYVCKSVFSTNFCLEESVHVVCFMLMQLHAFTPVDIASTTRQLSQRDYISSQLQMISAQIITDCLYAFRSWSFQSTTVTWPPAIINRHFSHISPHQSSPIPSKMYVERV